MKRISWILIAFLLPVSLWAEYPPCWGLGVGPGASPKIAILGDSRAGFLALGEIGGKGWISHASITAGGTVYHVIPDEQVDSVWNFGWFGKTSADWNQAMDTCRSGGRAVHTTPKMVINLGGNDMKSYYHELETLEAEYWLWTAITNPEKVLEHLYHQALGEPDHLVENFWYWMYELKEDEIVSNMDSLVYKLMNQNRNGYDALNEAVIVDVAPVLGTGVGDIAIINDFHKFVRINVYISRLNVKYYRRLIPSLREEHGATRIGFLDLNNVFLGNIIGGGLSYYWYPAPNEFPGDGIHFSSAGNQQFGLMLASLMALPKEAGGMGWFSKNPQLENQILFGLANNVPIDLSGLLPVTPAPDQCDDWCKFVCFYLRKCGF